MNPQQISNLITENIQYNNGCSENIYKYCNLYEDIDQQLPYLIKDLLEKYDEEQAEQIITGLAKIDPTPEKKNVGTFIKWINNNTYRYPEDNQKLSSAMVDYDKVSKSNTVPKLTKFKSLQDLELLMDKHLRPDVLKTDQRKIKIDKLSEFGSIFFNDGELAVVEVTDVESAVSLAVGTKWCTKDANIASDYLEDGSLFVIFMGGDKSGQTTGDKFGQFHLDTGQYKDLRDKDLGSDVVGEICNRSGLIDLIKKDPESACNYAINVIGGRWPEVEPIIMKNPKFVSEYAMYALRSRWSEAEPTIMKDPGTAYRYAIYVIGGRWPEAEPTIMKDPMSAYSYAMNIINGSWPEAEPTIMKNPVSASRYAAYIIGGRWSEAEPIIMKDPMSASNYAMNVIGGRWPEAEPTIMKDPMSAYNYARDVIGGRWPEAEPTIMKNLYYANEYKRNIL